MAYNYKRSLIRKIYEIISDEIENLYNGDLVSRDTITTALVNNSESRNLIESSLDNEKSEQKIWEKAGNYVDWLNADITRQFNRSKKWNDYYSRSKIKSKHPFTGKIRNVWGLAPMNLIQKSSQDNTEIVQKLEDKLSINETALFEGSTKEVSINIYERNESARKQCIEFYGASCRVCDFNFKDVYGDIGDGYIQVHHLLPLSQLKKNYEVNPYSDLIPVCPNCHAMIHQRKPPFAIEELKQIIKNNKE